MSATRTLSLVLAFALAIAPMLSAMHVLVGHGPTGNEGRVQFAYVHDHSHAGHSHAEDSHTAESGEETEFCLLIHLHAASAALADCASPAVQAIAGTDEHERAAHQNAARQMARDATARGPPALT